MPSHPRLLLCAALLCGGISSVALAGTKGRDAPRLYGDYCAGCHGAHMEGGKSASLVDSRWEHGGDDASILSSIRHGYPDEGMPAFGSMLNEAELRAMIAYIRETATRAVDPQPKEEDPLPHNTRHSELQNYRFEHVAEGLDVPWSLSFLPDHSFLVTERVGRLRVVDPSGHLQPEPIRGIPKVIARDEAGLMSVVADPDYAHNGWIYLTFSDPGEGENAMNKIVRGRIRDGAWVDEQTVFSIPKEHYPKGYVLFGGRLAFQGDYLYFSIGERGMEEGTTGKAQDLTVPNGKIHRVFHDGRVPPDNPFVDQPGAGKSIWAYGVRNPQGLAINPVTGELWESEHGPRGGDELNHIRRGCNYGWPVITYGMNYDGTPISEKTEAPGLEQPIINWTPSIAVSEIEFYTGDRFPRWKNQLFVGSLAQQKFLRIVLDGDRVVHREEVFSGLGRVRDIKTGPDGYIYIAIERIGKLGAVVRMVPAN